MPKIKIYGERNTGTNYLRKLIELNLDIEQIPGVIPKQINTIQKLVPGNQLVRDLFFLITFKKNFGWKHTLVDSKKILKCLDFNKNISFLTLTKNPYSWLLSLYRRPYNQDWGVKPSFEQFLVRKWKIVGRENYSGDPINPIELWNLKNNAYISFGNYVSLLNLKYEDLLLNPKNEAVRISSHFKISRISENFKNFNQSTKSPTKTTEYYKTYYLNELWKDDLSQESIDLISSQLKKEVMGFFGYDYLS